MCPLGLATLTPAPAFAADGIGSAWLLGAAALGALAALAGVVLSQRQRTQRELTSMRQALAASAAWSWRTGADGNVVEIERSHRDTEWFDCRRLLGRKPWEIDDSDEVPPALAPAIASRAPFFDIHLDVRLPTGRRVLGLSGAPLFSGTGRFIGYAGATHDLTPLLGAASAVAAVDGAEAQRVSSLQADLADRNRQLEDRSRELTLAAREFESFSHSVSHDLRAPLRVVDGFATIVLEDYGDRGKPLDDLGRDHLRRIVAASQRMNSMIDTLLSLARTTSRDLSRERVDLSQIARELVDDLQATDRTRPVKFVVAPDLWADGDATLLRLVLQNLLGNAWKFSAKNRSARIEFGLLQTGLSPVYFVKDNGAGFDMRFAEKMFGLFQRFHSANEFAGTGVGLATVQKIVRRHGGRVWAEAIAAPAEGHGATFHFTLWETPQRATGAS